MALEGLAEIAVVEGNQRRRTAWLADAGATRLRAAIPVWRKAHGLPARAALRRNWHERLRMLPKGLEIPSQRATSRAS
jgi:hypothetical protein